MVDEGQYGIGQHLLGSSLFVRGNMDNMALFGFFKPSFVILVVLLLLRRSASPVLAGLFRHGFLSHMCSFSFFFLQSRL
jgi:hypothetical protein